MNGSLRNKLSTAAIGAVLSCACPAWAQTSSAPPPTPPAKAFFYERVGPGPGGLGDAIGFVDFEGPLEQKVVTGAPFSATISQQTTQTLADGNHIVRNTSGSFARDTQGRVRRDITLPAIGPWAATGKDAPHPIFISDPVAGTHYVLDAERKVAHAESSRGGRNSGPHFDSAISGELQKETTTVSLGTQTINGVTAEGTRTIRTIPAGEIGNEKTITITVERWYSPDLQTVVLLKRSDPMAGDSVYQLTNIQRAEPDESLFQVPPDFTIEQGRGMRIQKRSPPEASPDAQ